MSTTANFLTKRIVFIAEVRDYGGSTPGYTSTSTEPYTSYFGIAAFSFTLNVVAFALIVGYIILKRKGIFLTTL